MSTEWFLEWHCSVLFLFPTLLEPMRPICRGAAGTQRIRNAPTDNKKRDGFPDHPAPPVRVLRSLHDPLHLDELSFVDQPGTQSRQKHNSGKRLGQVQRPSVSHDC